jgi:TPP-dependent pyruvate/acetoin dehydrogenase alpha subunit
MASEKDTTMNALNLPEPIAALKQLMRIRAVEETIASRYPDKEMRCPVHLSIGQEAVAVGVCAALYPSDYALSTHRGHAHYLAKGGDLNAMMAEIYGKAPGCAGGRGGSMHLIDLSVNMLGCTPIVGGSLPVGVGVAFSTWMEERDNVTAVFFGEAATEEGVFFESVNFAALKQLPIVFICENNRFSVYSPMSVRQPEARDRMAMARSNGLKVGSATGDDIEAVYALALQAVNDARSGGGPWYIEFDTYRWREHCGPSYDDELGYRDRDELVKRQNRCPVSTYKARLLDRKTINSTALQQLDEEIKLEVDAAFDFAKRAPFPAADRLLAGVYAEEQPQ